MKKETKEKTKSVIIYFLSFFLSFVCILCVASAITLVIIDIANDHVVNVDEKNIEIVGILKGFTSTSVSWYYDEASIVYIDDTNITLIYFDEDYAINFIEKNVKIEYIEKTKTTLGGNIYIENFYESLQLELKDCGCDK